VRALSATPGPGGDLLALQVERSNSRAEFASLTARVLGAVRARRGDQPVAAFLP
jgi:hypothetical protein